MLKQFDFSCLLCKLSEVNILSFSNNLLNQQWYRSGFLKCDIPAKLHKCHNLLYAVRKSTSKVNQLGRERVLPWYKGKKKRDVKFHMVNR